MILNLLLLLGCGVLLGLMWMAMADPTWHGPEDPQ